MIFRIFKKSQEINSDNENNQIKLNKEKNNEFNYDNINQKKFTFRVFKKKKN
jgi:hypothetical protein